MTVKQTIAALCRERVGRRQQPALPEKHQKLQDAFVRASSTLGVYAPPIAEIIEAITGFKPSPAATPFTLFDVITTEGSTVTNSWIIAGVAGAAGYAIPVLGQDRELTPQNYGQFNTPLHPQHKLATPSEVVDAMGRFLAHPAGDKDVVLWVNQKLGSQLFAVFLEKVTDRMAQG